MLVVTHNRNRGENFLLRDITENNCQDSVLVSVSDVIEGAYLLLIWLPYTLFFNYLDNAHRKRTYKGGGK